MLKIVEKKNGEEKQINVIITNFDNRCVFERKFMDNKKNKYNYFII